MNGSIYDVVDTTTVNITINGTDYNMPLISGNGVSGVYGYDYIFGAGSYNWSSIAENNESDSNTSDVWAFTINQSDPACELTVNHSNSVAYGNVTTSYCVCNTTEASGNFWFDSVNVTDLYNNTPVLLAVADRLFMCNITASANYTTDTVSEYYNITQAVPALDITFNLTSPQEVGKIINIGCTSPTQVTDDLFNDTTDIADPFVWDTTSLIDGTYNYTCNSTAVQNYTAGTIGESFVLTNVTDVLTIDQVFDEKNLSKTLTFDAEIFNSTYSITSTGITTYSNNEVRGDMTVVISATGYGTRYYYVDVPDNGTYNFSGYLVNESEGQNVLFTIKNYYDQLLPEVNINISRLSTTWRLVGQGVSDASGGFVFFVDDNANYKLTFEKSGYDTLTTNQILQLTSYTIYLNSGAVEKPSYWSYYKNLYTNCTFTNATRLLNCTWNDTSTHIVNTTLNVLVQNTTGHQYTLCSNTSAASAGAFICNFGAMDNNTFMWSMWMDTSSDPSLFLAESGSWTDAMAAVSLGTMGILIAMLIVLFSGFFGVQTGSPPLTVIMTVIGVVASMAMGFLSLGQSGATILMGLAISGGVVWWKMRSDEK